MKLDQEIEESLRFCEELLSHQEKKTTPPSEIEKSLQSLMSAVAMPKKEDAVEPEPQPVPEPQPEHEPQPEPELQPEPEPQPAPQLMVEPEPEPEFQMPVEPAPEPEPEPEPAAQPKEKSSGLVLEAVDAASYVKDGEGEEYREKHPVLRVMLNSFICIVAAFLLSLFITKFVAYHTSVEGSSMETSLQSGDQLVIEKASYRFVNPHRFDVIVFPYSTNVSYIKRIIGLPGETVRIEDGIVYINGEPLQGDHGKEEIEDPGLASEDIVLGADEYFVLGDNRNASVDSRRSEVGIIQKSQIQGKAWLRFFPFSGFGFVK